MAEFNVGGQTYRSNRMDAFTQFHVMRRLAPIFSNLKDAYADGSTDLSNGLEAAAKAIGDMTDIDSEYVLKACLDATKRKQGETYASLRAGGRLMFEDIGLQEMMQISWYVLRDNFSPFFSGLREVVSPTAGKE